MNDYTKKVALSIKRAAEKINSLRKENSLVFPIFTDLHIPDAKHEYMGRLLEALRFITQQIDYDAVINLGDNFSMLGREIHISNGELKLRFEKVFDAMYNAAGHPIINVHGNHDAVGTDFFKADFWNGIVKGKYGNKMAVYGDEGSYYYIDYEKANTRLVVLSLPHDSDIESEMPTPIWNFGKKQLDWLKETAFATNKDVIILSHVPFFYKYTGDKEKTLGVWTGNEEKKSYISALCGCIEDVEDAVEIIEKYKLNSGAKIVACLSGHTHADSLWLPHEQKDEDENPLPCHQVVTTSACYAKGDVREIGISIDIAVWNPSMSRLDLVRIGDGEDRRINL